MISNVVCVCVWECRRHHFFRIARFKFAKIVGHSVFEILSSSISFLFHCFINIFFEIVFWFLQNAATDRTHTIFDKTRETLYTPASSARFVTYRMFVKPSFFLNLPGWRWGSITQNPLVAVSRPLHSGVCETRQDIGLPVLHSEISDSGLLRTRGDQQYHKQFLNEPRVIERVDALCFFVFAFLWIERVDALSFSFFFFCVFMHMPRCTTAGFESGSNPIRIRFESDSNRNHF